MMDAEYTKEEYVKDTQPVSPESPESPESTESVYQKMYCGPNIPKKGLFTYQVFYGGLPFSVKEATEEIPEIEKLLCDVKDADEFRKKIRTKGTLEYTYNERIRQVIG